MIIKTIDLITIFNSAKIFKKKQFVLYHNTLYDVSNIDNYFTHTQQLELSIDYSVYGALYFDYKLLSDFVKNITIEEQFEVINGGISSMVTLEDNIGFLQIESSILYKNIIEERINLSRFVNQYQYVIDGPITDKIQQVLDMKKADGVFNYIEEINGNKYFMTLFPRLLPVNKGDNVYASIIDNHDTNSFITKFTVEKKKKFKIYIYLAYLKV